MYMKHDLSAMGENIVYLRAVDAADLPDEVRQQAGAVDTLFAVHNTKGEQLAIVTNPAIANDLAAANNMRLVTVH